jgi:alkyl sulfatase BDS1-like metallo-beta-lactamase superfamily hydrolase
VDMTNPEMAMALTVGQLIDSLAVRVDGPRAWDTDLTVDWELTDERSTWRLTLSNGALTHHTVQAFGPRPRPADLVMTLTKPQLLAALAGHGLDGVTTDGDPAVLTRLLALLDTPDPDFPVVTP